MNKQYRIELLIAVDSTGIPHTIKFSHNTASDRYCHYYTKLGHREHTLRCSVYGETEVEVGTALPEIEDYDAQSYFTAKRTDAIKTAMDEAGMSNTVVDKFISVAIYRLGDYPHVVTCRETMRGKSFSAEVSLPEAYARKINLDPTTLAQFISEQGFESLISTINDLFEQAAA